MANQEEMAQDTLESPVPFHGDPTSHDIYDLLGAIHKIETLEGPQVLLSASEDKERETPLSPFPHSNRICKVLDSLATLCVSQRKHEVIALATRYDATNRTIRFMIASDADVLPETEKPFQNM
ncbi:uncharacterized protein N7473_008040 [Penicillium subrubescens]|uniref:Uncharacterized protein n=1 Tax=Penicillium subrubescens TaxID=1316194 RepID=A0A1Q5TFG1_9EURO|nr:uncharacterized protein N7473_008040 [Penicillium subrubescens]KAJ5891812.1 hypothetical protein N7473_008040 [Penicillium subrubescens]OKO98969.1 hypothetical protein PENSUB_8886 [Penicillium subrubescens]